MEVTQWVWAEGRFLDQCSKVWGSLGGRPRGSPFLVSVPVDATFMLPTLCCFGLWGLRPKPLSVYLLPWIRKIRLLNQRSRIWAKPLEMARTWGQLSIFFLCLCKIKRVLFYFWWWELEKVTALTAWLTGLLINHELREGKGLACSHTAVRVESCLLVHPAFSSCPYSRHPHPSLKS